MADRNDWDRNRDREQEMDRERGAHRLDYGRNREARGYDATRWENEGGRTESEREGRGNFPRYEDRSRNYQDDYRRGHERGEWSGGSRAAGAGQRGDWGKQASWGTYGNRPGYDQRYDRREERYDQREAPSNPGNPASRRNGEDFRHGGPQYGYSGGQYRGSELESSLYGGQYIGEYGGRSTGRSEGQHNQMGGMSAGHSGGMFGGGMPSGGYGYGGGMGSYSGGFGEQGRHAGRGPKNWQRSDDRIKEDVNERLTEHSLIDATEIDIAVKNGEVTVSGSVDDRRTKRLVEDLIEGVSGVKEVHNQLRSNHAFQPEGMEKAKSAMSQASEGQTAGGQSRK